MRIIPLLEVDKEEFVQNIANQIAKDIVDNAAETNKEINLAVEDILTNEDYLRYAILKPDDSTLDNNTKEAIASVVKENQQFFDTINAVLGIQDDFSLATNDFLVWLNNIYEKTSGNAPILRDKQGINSLYAQVFENLNIPRREILSKQSILYNDNMVKLPVKDINYIMAVINNTYTTSLSRKFNLVVIDNIEDIKDIVSDKYNQNAFEEKIIELFKDDSGNIDENKVEDITNFADFNYIEELLKAFDYNASKLKNAVDWFTAIGKYVKKGNFKKSSKQSSDSEIDKLVDYLTSEEGKSKLTKEQKEALQKALADSGE